MTTINLYDSILRKNMERKQTIKKSRGYKEESSRNKNKLTRKKIANTLLFPL